MKVAIFGATGIVGRAITKEALDRGYEVTVLTRAASHVTEKNPNLHVVVGDVMDAATVLKVVTGQDAVIQTLGIGGKGNGKPTHFVSSATKVIIEQMERAGVKRLIAISVIGAGDSRNFLPWIYRAFILPVFQKWFVPIIADKNRMEKEIEASPLDWTIIRCTTVKDAPATGHVAVALHNGKGLKFHIAAPDMARFFVDELKYNEYLRLCPTISN